MHVRWKIRFRCEHQAFTKHKARVCACHTLQTGCSPHLKKSTSSSPVQIIISQNYTTLLIKQLGEAKKKKKVKENNNFKKKTWYIIKVTLFLHLPWNRLQIAAVVSYNADQNFPLAADAILESEKTLGPRGRGDFTHVPEVRVTHFAFAPFRAERPLYLCSQALQYSPRLFPLLL